MKATIYLTTILFHLIISIQCKSQTIGAGASAIYNIQTESFGAGARVTVFPNSRISLTPQFSYFFPFNKINEYTIGLGLEGKFIKHENINLYAVLHGGYNSWINYKSSGLKDAKTTNWNFEGGIGISTNTCLRPFLEYRYNLKFRETHLNLGFIFIFGCRNNKGLNTDKCQTFK